MKYIFIFIFVIISGCNNSKELKIRNFYDPNSTDIGFVRKSTQISNSIELVHYENGVSKYNFNNVENGVWCIEIYQSKIYFTNTNKDLIIEKLKMLIENPNDNFEFQIKSKWLLWFSSESNLDSPKHMDIDKILLNNKLYDMSKHQFNIEYAEQCHIEYNPDNNLVRYCQEANNWLKTGKFTPRYLENLIAREEFVFDGLDFLEKTMILKRVDDNSITINDHHCTIDEIKEIINAFSRF